MQTISDKQQEEESKITAGILQLIASVERLRSPTEGCLWFRRQTLQTVRRYLLEEVYEVLEPLDTESPEKLQEELGDLLFQIIVLSQMASERSWFSLPAVLHRLNEKIIYRNPHVFGELQADTEEAVQQIWLERKSLEKCVSGNTIACSLDRLSAAMPALALAQVYISRTGYSMTDGTFPDRALLDEIEDRISSLPNSESWLGGLLFDLTGLAQHYHMDAEIVLQKFNAQFRQQFSTRVGNLLQDTQG
jgi:MazG family protein